MNHPVAVGPSRRQPPVEVRQSVRSFLMLWDDAPAFPPTASVHAQWVLGFYDRLACCAWAGEERNERLTALLESELDMDAFGRATLGWRWPTATAEQRQSFGRGLRRVLVEEFFGRLPAPDERAVIVVAIRLQRGAATVMTELVSKRGAASLKVAWRLVTSEGRSRLSDVAVDSVSLAGTLRAQFDIVLRDDDGATGPVLSILERMEPLSS